MKTFFILSCLATCVLAQDYCAMSCTEPSVHVGCNNDGSFGDSCNGGGEQVEMTPEIIENILDDHNNYRNTIAGEFLGVTAANMSTMKWDAELATLAQLNANSCDMQHDCHNTIEFPNSGQNIYQSGTTGSLTNHLQLIRDGITEWYSEKQYCSLDQIRSYPSEDPANAIGHFTTMIRDTSTHVGCGATTYPSDGFNWIQFTCNYAETNMIGAAIFIEGPVASECNSGTNSIYPNLCA